jgi:uncharacterized protein YciI
MWMVEYTYDDQTERRDAARPAHRAYLASLVDRGDMIAYGRFDDDLTPGALLIYVGETADAIEGLIAADPFVRDSLVSHHRIRKWDGMWRSPSA